MSSLSTNERSVVKLLRPLKHEGRVARRWRKLHQDCELSFLTPPRTGLFSAFLAAPQRSAILSAASFAHSLAIELSTSGVVPPKSSIA